MTASNRIIQLVLAGAFAWVLVPSHNFTAREIVAAAPTPQASPAACDSSRSIDVTGTASVNVTPDQALLRLGVQSTGNAVDAVEKANSNSIQNVMKALLRQGVEAKDISTDIYMIEPVYENFDSLYIKGYRINNEVAVTVRDVNRTSVLVAAALKAGANQVNNVEFYTTELRKYRDQARELAVTAAREKAVALASATGAEPGCVIHINENTWSYFNGWWYGRSQNLWTQNVVQNVSSAGAPESAGDEPISLGKISVKAEVSVTYSLKE